MKGKKIKRITKCDEGCDETKQGHVIRNDGEGAS